MMTLLEKGLRDEIDILISKVIDLQDELLAVYSYLYPERDIVSLTNTEKGLELPLSLKQRLNILRTYHKEQLEKEKIKKLIKECMGEIK